MKKFGIVILTFIYLTSTSGVMVHMHYCMGELADWGFGRVTSAICSFCGMDKGHGQNNGCCKDEFTFIQNHTDQHFNESGSEPVHTNIIDLPVFHDQSLPLVATSSKALQLIHHPPPRGVSGIQTCVLNQVFRL